MKIEIEVKEEKIREIVVKKLSDDLLNQGWSYEARDVKKIFAEVSKELLYAPDVKKKLIADTVNRASAEVARKALPKLVEKMAKEKA